MDAMAAAAAAAACAASSRDARLPDFSLDKPEVWFSMVEACFEDCNITNEKPVVLSRLNSLKPATLEELYMAIFLRVLPDSYREHFAQNELRTAEEMAAKADGLWEMRGGAAAMVAAISRPASPRRRSPGRGQQDGGGGGGGDG
jgi:hypothetical protein